MRLSNLTWPHAEEYFRDHDTVLIGIGSIECHGRHMPLGTDTLIPDFLIDKIEAKTDALICPTLPYGATESLCDYPGTINLGTELLYQVLSRVCDSLFQHGARRFVILNGHGGNVKAIDRVGYDIQRKGGILAELNWWLMAWDMDCPPGCFRPFHPRRRRHPRRGRPRRRRGDCRYPGHRSHSGGPERGARPHEAPRRVRHPEGHWLHLH